MAPLVKGVVAVPGSKPVPAPCSPWPETACVAPLTDGTAPSVSACSSAAPKLAGCARSSGGAGSVSVTVAGTGGLASSACASNSAGAGPAPRPAWGRASDGRSASGCSASSGRRSWPSAWPICSHSSCASGEEGSAARAVVTSAVSCCSSCADPDVRSCASREWTASGDRGRFMALSDKAARPDAAGRGGFGLTGGSRGRRFSGGRGR